MKSYLVKCILSLIFCNPRVNLSVTKNDSICIYGILRNKCSLQKTVFISVEIHQQLAEMLYFKCIACDPSLRFLKNKDVTFLLYKSIFTVRLSAICILTSVLESRTATVFIPGKKYGEDIDQQISLPIHTSFWSFIDVDSCSRKHTLKDDTPVGQIVSLTS